MAGCFHIVVKYPSPCARARRSSGVSGIGNTAVTVQDQRGATGDRADYHLDASLRHLGVVECYDKLKIASAPNGPRVITPPRSPSSHLGA